MKAEQTIYERLHTRGLGWHGGQTSFDLALSTGIHIRTIRRVLRKMMFDGKVEACAPHKFDRLDGRTAATLLWYRV